MRAVVIVPVRGRAELLDACLQALAASTRLPDEVIVVDDGSPKDSAVAVAALCQRHRARLLTQAPAGPAAARNHGAQQTDAELLIFLDSDVTVRADTLARLIAAFDDPGLAAVFGSYDDQPSARTLASDYRNLLHHYVHQHSRRQASTFWAGCGAVRRSAFLAAGGFSAAYDRPSIEDVEFGLRLSAAGQRIELHPDIQVCHAKQWTVRSFFIADTRYRAVPWTELILSRPDALPPDLNFGWRNRLSVPLAGLLAFALLLTLGLPWLGGALVLLTATALAACNAPFLSFLWQRRGPLFALGAFPLHILHYLASGLGAGWALLRTWRRLDPQVPYAALAFAATVILLQAVSGTYSADFAAHPDEAGHFVTGVMVTDFLRHPTLAPMHFAEQYYLHYPRVSLGHWPPFFYLVEGVWFALTGVSRASALVLQAILGFLLLLGVYAFARSFLKGTAAFGAAALLALTPPFYASVTSVMADSATSVTALAAAGVFALYLQRPGMMLSLGFGFCAALALLTKGTAGPLVFFPVLAVLISRRFRVLLRADFWLSAVPVLLLAGPWYAFSRHFPTPNQSAIRVLPPTTAAPPPSAYRVEDWSCWQEYGWPLLILAAVGALLIPKRHPAAAAVVALVLAFLIAPLALVGLLEGRHLLPAAAAACVAAAGCWQRSTLVLVPALACALWLRGPVVAHGPAVFGPLVESGRLDTGTRMLIAGNAFEEGSLIAAVAAREPHPRRVILRSSRFLAVSDWNGKNYQLLAGNEAEVLRLLQANGVSLVILASLTSPEQILLRQAVHGWPAGQAGPLTLAANPNPTPASSLQLHQPKLQKTLKLDPAP